MMAQIHNHQRPKTRFNVVGSGDTMLCVVASLDSGEPLEARPSVGK